MKYLVELKFTNPSHEHVSLRRRVETVTRIVEATNEDQALLRASQQQRALGFKIQEAKVVKEKSHDNEKSSDKTVVAMGKEVFNKKKKDDEDVEAVHRSMEKTMKKEEKGGTASYPLLKKGEKIKPMKLKEDPETVDEAAKDWKKAFGKVATKNLNKDVGALRAKVSRLKYVGMKPTVNDTPHRVTAKVTGDVYSEAAVAVNEADRELNIARALTKHIANDRDLDKRDKGYKMSPAVRAAQKKSDALSKVEKPKQAGTLGAHKARNAAEKMVKKAKERVNPINMNPQFEPGKTDAKV